MLISKNLLQGALILSCAMFYESEAGKLKKTLKKGLLMHTAMQMMEPHETPSMTMMMMPVSVPMKAPCPEPESVIPEIIEIDDLHLLGDHHHHYHDVHINVVEDNAVRMPRSPPRQMKMKTMQPMDRPMIEMEDEIVSVDDIPMPPPVRYESKSPQFKAKGGYRGVNPRMLRAL